MFGRPCGTQSEGRENTMAMPQDAAVTQNGHEMGGDRPWSFARVRIDAGESIAPSDAPLVLWGVYEGSDESTVAAAITGHILEDLRRHALRGRSDPAQSDGTRVRVRITIERLPDLWEVPRAGEHPASGEAAASTP